jgi:microcystin-dependent protein
MDNYAGELRMVGFNFAPEGWALCTGQLMAISDGQALFDLIGTTYGGDGQGTFGLPDLQGRIAIGSGQGPGLSQRALGAFGGEEAVMLTVPQMPAHSHAFLASTDTASSDAPEGQVLASELAFELYLEADPSIPLSPGSITLSGASQPHTNLQPYLVVNYIISLGGAPPSEPAPEGAQPFVAEIRAFPWSFVPQGWAPCKGQLMSIAQNPMLFQLLGTWFGGDGRTTFALPNLVGQAAVGAGQGAGRSSYWIGESGGDQTVTLLGSESPSHGHRLLAAPGSGDLTSPAALAQPESGSPYMADQTPAAMLAAAAVSTAGGSAPHNNMQPYLALNYAVALTGVFPPRG